MADENVDLSSTIIDEDAPLEDDVVRSLRTSPVHLRDRTSIDDFEIMDTISRGAFGHVILARKKTTGDLFAIKVFSILVCFASITLVKYSVCAVRLTWLAKSVNFFPKSCF